MRAVTGMAVTDSEDRDGREQTRRDARRACGGHQGDIAVREAPGLVSGEIGGNLGKSVPTLGFKAVEFVPRTAVLTAADALIEVFVTYGNFDKPNKARMKLMIASVSTRHRSRCCPRSPRSLPAPPREGGAVACVPNVSPAGDGSP